MNQSNQHIIEKQFLHLQLSSQKDSFSLQQDMSKLFWELISPAMEQLFDQFSTSDEVIILEKLEIDLGKIAPKDLEKVLVQKIVRALEEALTKAIISNPKQVQKLPLKQRHFEQWIYFLETGVMPVRSAYTEEAVFQQAVLDTLGLNSLAIQQLQETLQQHPQAFQRLILQHQDSFLKTIVELFSGIRQTELLDMLPILTKAWTAANLTKKDLSSLDLPQFNSSTLPLYFWAFILKESIFKHKKQTPKLWAEQLMTFALNEEKQAKLLPVLKKEIAQKAPIQSFFSPIIKKVEKAIESKSNRILSSPEATKAAIVDEDKASKADAIALQKEEDSAIENEPETQASKKAEIDKPANQASQLEEEKKLLKDKKTDNIAVDKIQHKAEQTALSEDISAESTEESPPSKSLSSKPTEQKTSPTTEAAKTTKSLDQQQKGTSTEEQTPASASNVSEQEKKIKDIAAKKNKTKDTSPSKKQEQKTANSKGEISKDSLASQPPHELSEQEKNQEIDSESLVPEKQSDAQPEETNQKEASASASFKQKKEADNLAKPPKPTSKKTTKPPPEPKIGSSFYITQAGLVLVHAFLPHLFKHLKLVEGKTFVDDSAQEKAVHIIYYLATGKTNPPEYELLLPKLLCQIPFHQAMARDILLSEEEKKEANNLLKAAIKHWGKLGKASPDALREGFFQRDGKLTKKEQGWYLQVEEKSLDVLLDFLPWSISMIRLPWMKELLRVEWTK